VACKPVVEVKVLLEVVPEREVQERPLTGCQPLEKSRLATADDNEMGIPLAGCISRMTNWKTPLPFRRVKPCAVAVSTRLLPEPPAC
jgi:hypothetical protein